MTANLELYNLELWLEKPFFGKPIRSYSWSEGEWDCNDNCWFWTKVYHTVYLILYDFCIFLWFRCGRSSLQLCVLCFSTERGFIIILIKYSFQPSWNLINRGEWHYRLRDCYSTVCSLPCNESTPKRWCKQFRECNSSMKSSWETSDVRTLKEQ